MVPPTCDDFSHSTTSNDFFAASSAALRPAHPLPMTMTSRSPSHG
ncbi:Uncharacterised protein [Bordetella pertussis]|nr:Uncharacterised protein [Bordetella pertussis]